MASTLHGSLSIKATKKSRAFLGENPKRETAVFYNKSPHTLYLNLRNLASEKQWVVILEQNDYYELPTGTTDSVFGVWDGDEKGYCRISEFNKA